MKRNYLDLLDQIRSIAQLGLNYTKDPYDQERYKKLLGLASESYSEITGLPAKEIGERFSKELGYITPKIGVQGALIDPAGKILLERRMDDSLWGLPSGWVEAGETPEMALVREFREETNLEIEPVTILGFYTRLPGEYYQPHTSVHILYFCHYISGVLKKSHESLEMEYCDPSSIEDWHKDHRQQAEKAIQYKLAGERGDYLQYSAISLSGFPPNANPFL
jgi:ADP-ribose pyrophosphatase YjhB (NUDIX family)